MKSSNKHRQMWKVGFVALALMAWASIPFFTNEKVQAGGDSVPILVRTAILSAPGGGVNPHGEGEYQLYESGQRELEIEAEDVSMPDGTVLSVFIDGAQAGTMTLSRQKGKLKLRTEDGQAIPIVNDGSTAQVRNGETVVVAGIFGGGGPTPTPTGSPSPGGSTTPTPGSTTPTPGGTTPTPGPTVSPNPGNLFAGLSGATINGVLPGGYAEFEVHSSRLELEARIRQVNLPAGTSLAVIVNDAPAGTMVLESGGEARLRLRSDRGDNIPVIVSGSTIRLNSGATTVLSGTFSGFSATPSPTPAGSPTPGGSPTPSPSPSLGRSFEANLTGAQVTPPVTTAATGEFKVTLNAEETQATIFGEFHNLSSAQTGARIENTVGSVTLVHDFGAIGGTNGNFAGVTIDVSAAQVQLFRTGLVQAVITSANNPGGEIASLFRQRSNRADFDGDGGNDLALFRPSTGTWYTQNSAGFSAQTFGTANDKIVSADYDGDGKTDAAMFKNVGGMGIWEIKRSSDGGVTTAQFGLASDIPVRGDFDGDGRADVGVFRPSDGNWYVQQSTGGYTGFHFGATGDQPVASDMDGDGKDDVVVFRPSNGDWYWLNSSNGQFAALHWGATGDIPAIADMDGDGKQDVTVFRPSDGGWYWLGSSNGQFSALHFGLLGDVPVAGNYDGDGKTDIAVYRPSDGMWYINRSSDGGFEAIRFGIGEDIPVIAK